MKRIALSWIAGLVGALVLGPVAGSLVAGLRTSDGGSAVTMLTNTNPVAAILAVVVGVVLATGLGAAGARAISVRMGFFAAGTVLAWPAWQMGAVEEVIRSARSASPLWAMAFEGVIVLLLGAALAGAVCRIARHDDPDTDTDPLISEQSLRGAVAALLVGGLLAWIFAREALKGQSMAAAGVGAIGGATVGRLAAPRCSSIALVAGLLFLGVIAPIVGVLTSGGSILQTVYAGGLFPLARLSPLDWLAGALMGAPIGLAWSASMLEKRSEQPA